MKQTYDLSRLDWTLAGFIPFDWKLKPLTDIRTITTADVPAVPASVPGSVQSALLTAGVIPDWNLGLNARACEWVENRHWIFQAALPDAWTAAHAEQGERIQLDCLGLDDRGWVLLNGEEIGSFNGAFTPHSFDLTGRLLPTGNLLQIAFDLPPRWLGQIGYTSQMTEWKPRFYYTWDWTSRVVQIGIWDTLSLIVTDDAVIQGLKCTADANLLNGTGTLNASGRAGAGEDCSVELALRHAGETLREERLPVTTFNASGIRWENLPVTLWQPNGAGAPGAQPLYTFTCRLLDASGKRIDEEQRTVGFKHVEWQACEGAPDGADPWICVVNGQALFLQGFNWTPVLPNFADVSEEDYRARLEVYRDLGCNILRVWGGAFLEKEVFYRLCDELGLLIWQEFPLSSSGIDNWPPEDEASIADLSRVAESYIERRQHHAALLCWCGGNELQGALDGSKQGIGKPVDLSHPLIRRFAEIVGANDPERRFLPTSSSGPRFSVTLAEIGQGLHWDVHGPWKLEGTPEEWDEFWSQDDALFHSEVGAPGASPLDIIERFSGGLPVLPASNDNPLWHRTSWWVEWPDFIAGMGREPRDLPEFVAWSQERQARALQTVARTLKSRFPHCGGVIFWMGHDSFPCTANTSVIDFLGRPKPAALALRKVFRS